MVVVQVMVPGDHDTLAEACEAVQMTERVRILLKAGTHEVLDSTAMVFEAFTMARSVEIEGEAVDGEPVVVKVKT